MSSGLEANKEPALESSWSNAKAWLRTHFFRVWTAGGVLAGYLWAWVYAPEALTWWKRSTTTMIEAGCDLLPYPWGDRIEATLGNFGLWVQITLAIIVFRVLVWLVISLVRRILTGRGRGHQRSPAIAADDSPTRSAAID